MHGREQCCDLHWKQCGEINALVEKTLTTEKAFSCSSDQSRGHVAGEKGGREERKLKRRLGDDEEELVEGENMEVEGCAEGGEATLVTKRQREETLHSGTIPSKCCSLATA